MPRIQITVSFDLDKDIDYWRDVEEIAGHVASSVEDDFGWQAEGGYDGPIADNVTWSWSTA